MVGVFWIIAGAFIGALATMPIALSWHHARQRQWEGAIGSAVVGLILGFVAIAQIEHGVALL